MPSQLVNANAIDASAVTHTSSTCSTVGTPAMKARVMRSRRVSRRLWPCGTRWDGAGPEGGTTAASGLFGVVSVVIQQLSSAQEDAKIVFFWRSIEDSRLSTPLGFWRNFCSEGCITVEVKSGRESRSMNCVRLFAPAIISNAFFCNGEYAAVDALFEAATTLGSPLR